MCGGGKLAGQAGLAARLCRPGRAVHSAKAPQRGAAEEEWFYES